MEICPSGKCTACAACLNACPCGAIEMREDSFGELHPVVCADKCRQCGLCQKTCPVNSPMAFRRPAKCWAAWTTDVAWRAECASGGLATRLARYVVENKGGVIVGTAYDGTMTPRVVFAESLSEIARFKGSKYVQSIVSNNTYARVRDHLNSGRWVLFSGTPCQVAGLKSFLGRDFDHLVTVDILCHGVSPVRYFKEELKSLSKTHGITDIANVRFRGNDDDNSRLSLLDRILGNYNSNNFRFTVWGLAPDGKPKRLYSGDSTRNYYLAGFLLGVSLRENCYSCAYARPERVSDITLGDFINLGKSEPFSHPRENVSVVLTNTSRGERFFSEAMESDGALVAVERQFEERLSYPFSLVKSFPRHPLNAKFRRLYVESGYVQAIRRTLRFSLFKSRIFRRMEHFSRLPVYALDRIKRRICCANGPINQPTTKSCPTNSPLPIASAPPRPRTRPDSPTSSRW